MSAAELSTAHREAWLLLPWLANGRLSAAETLWVEEHLQHCARCSEELAAQRCMCLALHAPDRVSYAPGPSFRKLLDRLDKEAPADARTNVGATRDPEVRGVAASLWRPPGLAWAASFIVMVGLTAIVSTTYRWLEPRYVTRTDVMQGARPGVLHIAFEPNLAIQDVEDLLQANGARVVEGPDASGIFGVAARAGGSSLQQTLALAARLRNDPRVRWVEPLGAAESRESRTTPGQGPSCGVAPC